VICYTDVALAVSQYYNLCVLSLSVSSKFFLPQTCSSRLRDAMPVQKLELTPHVRFAPSPWSFVLSMVFSVVIFLLNRFAF
jgi:hypothetical protein